jgi:hypothetical protein
MVMRISREDRVRAATKPEVNRKIDMELEQRLRFYATQEKSVITERLEELDSEWDIERVLETSAASISLFGIFLGATSGRKWFLLPLIVSGFLLQHAIQGWCPPLPFFRSRGVRTRMEIEQERCALKMLRGDFEHLERTPGTATANTGQLAAMVRT